MVSQACLVASPCDRRSQCDDESAARDPWQEAGGRTVAGGESLPSRRGRAGVLVAGRVVRAFALAGVGVLRVVAQFQRVGHGDDGAFDRGRIAGDVDAAGPGGVGGLASGRGLAVDLDGDAVRLAVGQAGRRDVRGEPLMEGRPVHARLHDGLQGLRVEAVAGLRDGLRSTAVVVGLDRVAALRVRFREGVACVGRKGIDFVDYAFLLFYLVVTYFK